MTTLLFFGALIAPLLYALTNHIDKILLEKHLKSGDGVGVLMLFSALLSIAVLPVVYVIDSTAVLIGGRDMAIMTVVGCLNLLLLWCYLNAMDDEEPTVVIIFYQMLPVMGLFLGYFILGELVTTTQVIAMMLVIAGASVMTFAIDADGKFNLKFKTFGFMLVASLCWALESVLFKLVALEESVWKSLFWESLSMSVVGVLMFVFISRYRKSFLNVFRANSKKIVGLNIFNEVVYIFGNASASFMVVKILVAINLLMNSFQPIFVFLIGVILHKFLPHIATEAHNTRLAQKTVAIILTGIGVYLIGDIK